MVTDTVEHLIAAGRRCSSTASTSSTATKRCRLRGVGGARLDAGAEAAVM